MDLTPVWVKGGATRRAVALLIDLLIVMIVAQGLTALLYPAAGGRVIDSTGFLVDCRPAPRPADVVLPPGFDAMADDDCTRSWFGLPVMRAHVVTGRSSGPALKISLTRILDADRAAAVTFDVASLHGLLLVLMRWLVERQGGSSPGRLLMGLRLIPLVPDTTDAERRRALSRRYLVFAFPLAIPAILAALIFAAAQVGLQAPDEALSALVGLAQLPSSVAVVAAMLAVARRRDAFYDAAAGTTVVQLVEGARQVDPEERAAPAGGRSVPAVTLRGSAMALTLGLLLTGVFIGEAAFSYATSGQFAITPQTIILWGGTSYELVVQAGQWYRLALAPFLHWGAFHLFANLALLLAAGLLIEPLLGAGWLLAVFLLGGMAASAASVAFGTTGLLAAGASGALMALTGAGLVMSSVLPDGARRLGLQALCIAVLLQAVLLKGQIGPHMVDQAAHLGGALAGVALGFGLRALWRSGQDGLRLGWPAGACAAALAALTFVSVSQAGFGDVPLVRLQIPQDQLPKTDDEWAARAGELVRRFPRDPRSHLAAAIAAGSDNAARDAALAALDHAYAGAPAGEAARWRRNALVIVGKTRRKAYDFDAAKELFGRAILAGFTPDASLLGLRADAAQALGQFDAAKADLEAQLRLQPDNLAALNALAALLSAMGDQRAALEKADEVLLRQPDSVSAQRQRGWFLLLDGRYAEAVPVLEIAARLAPSDAYSALWLHLASLRAGQGGRIAEASASIAADAWPAPVLHYFRSEIDEKALIATAADRDPVKAREQVCEAHFYIGERHLANRDPARADSYLFVARMNCPKTFYEWAGARAELRRLGQ
ncbi:rhomboid family intramembrane serine protease [Bosea sp. PAMC 26642]|uniref:rhomboid family intramembrane serine protease n=1 Tax=Bosea sp. (strain PAMC 26642) TaxID=1792307 RepID=UPI00077025D0|nr:rhomboid family intramembrane serine protease [Bosea sp. PAMC 26642]AMJ59349.1 hypothetical protein AXW83_02660 [Bosea sp. PAMC 26642]